MLRPGLLLPLLALAAPVFAAKEEPPASPWRDASLGMFKEAGDAFAARDDADSRLGRALTLLLRQPKTAANLDQAAALLEKLAAEAPASETGLAARYYLGRVEHAHRLVPDHAAARAHYRALVALRPDHPYAEQAVVKLAILDLYEPVSDAERRARFDDYHARLPALASTDSRRDLALLLADAAQRFGYPSALALDCLLVADQAGIARRFEQANIWVRLGELAAENGRPDLARDYYGRFLAAYARDTRRRAVADRLAALPAPAAASPAAR